VRGSGENEETCLLSHVSVVAGRLLSFVVVVVGGVTVANTTLPQHLNSLCNSLAFDKQSAQTRTLLSSSLLPSSLPPFLFLFLFPALNPCGVAVEVGVK